MISEPAEQAEQQHPPNPQPGWLKKTLLLPIDWWPVTITALPVAVIACYPYGISAMEISKGNLLLGAGFAAFGLFVNIAPPGTVWAAMKFIR